LPDVFPHQRQAIIPTAKTAIMSNRAIKWALATYYHVLQRFLLHFATTIWDVPFRPSVQSYLCCLGGVGACAGAGVDEEPAGRTSSAAWFAGD